MSFICSLLSHCFNCTNGKIWEPSGGQNNICKSHSALTTSARYSDKVKFCWSCIINMFDQLLPPLLSMCVCTYPVCHHLCYTKCLNLSRQLKQWGFYCGWRSVIFNCWSRAKWLGHFSTIKWWRNGLNSNQDCLSQSPLCRSVHMWACSKIILSAFILKNGWNFLSTPFLPQYYLWDEKREPYCGWKNIR